MTIEILMVAAVKMEKSEHITETQLEVKIGKMCSGEGVCWREDSRILGKSRWLSNEW